MPDTKNFSLRVKVLDGLLRTREGVTIHEMLQVVNERLEERGIRPVRTKDTILKDITEMANEFHVRVLRVRDDIDSRIVRYRYEDSDFSIYETGLTARQTRELRYSLRLLARCKGFPKLKWVQDLCSSMDVPVNDDQEPVLEFDTSIGKLGRKCFQGLFFAIVEQRTVEIAYCRRPDSLENLVIYPYYMKQFARKWYLLAMCIDEPDTLKLFEIAKIKSFNFHPEKEYKSISMDLGNYFSDIYGIHRDSGKSPVTIRFQVSRHHIDLIIDDPIHHSQVLISHSHDGAIFSIRVIPNNELTRKFLSYGDTVTILTDCELRDEIVKRLKKSMRNYELST